MTNQESIEVCYLTIRKETMDPACLDGATSGWDGKGWAMVVLSGDSMCYRFGIGCGGNDERHRLCLCYDVCTVRGIRRVDEGWMKV